MGDDFLALQLGRFLLGMDYRSQAVSNDELEYLKAALDHDKKTFTLVGGERITNVHPSYKCAGRVCCVHSPSDHHMKEWPQHWRDDKGIMERICSHGTGHPDPDDHSFNTSHGCDGCCIKGG